MDYRNRILDKLLPPLDPNHRRDEGELKRVLLIYKLHIEEGNDPYLIKYFRQTVKRTLSSIFRHEFQFYTMDWFEKEYQLFAQEFIEDFLDADEESFIAHCLEVQQKIIEKTFRYVIELDGYGPINVVQFVGEDFFDGFIPSSGKKITYLEEKLASLKNPQTADSRTDYPFSYLFKSEEIYEGFMDYIDRYITPSDFYQDYSYLKKRLESEDLIRPTKDNEFMRIMYEDIKSITQNQYEIYQDKSPVKLSSLRNSNTLPRQQNFDKIFSHLLQGAKKSET